MRKFFLGLASATCFILALGRFEAAEMEMGMFCFLLAAAAFARYRAVRRKEAKKTLRDLVVIAYRRSNREIPFVSFKHREMETRYLTKSEKRAYVNARRELGLKW